MEIIYIFTMYVYDAQSVVQSRTRTREKSEQNIIVVNLTNGISG